MTSNDGTFLKPDRHKQNPKQTSLKPAPSDQRAMTQQRNTNPNLSFKIHIETKSSLLVPYKWWRNATKED